MSGEIRLTKKQLDFTRMIYKNIKYFQLVTIFVIAISNSFCQSSSIDSKNKIDNFINIARNEPIQIFEGWGIWKRSDGLVFDFLKSKLRFLIVTNKKDDYVFKEIFPIQDTTFHSLLEMEKRSDHYPFRTKEFSDKVLLFIKLKTDQINSINEDGVIMFISEYYSVIYCQKGKDLRELSRYKNYSKYDSNWYYYLKE